MHANQHQVIEARVRLDDLVRQPANGASDASGIEYGSACARHGDNLWFRQKKTSRRLGRFGV
jgi:hypothetical protein